MDIAKVRAQLADIERQLQLLADDQFDVERFDFALLIRDAELAVTKALKF